MFTLYQSNNLNILKNKMFNIIYKKKKNIFLNNFFILIPNNNISLMLKMFLANKIGIYANLKFILTGKFIWKLYKILLPKISNNYFFKKNNLILVILYLLPKCINFKEFYIIKRYLKNDYNNNKLFNLSIRISNIYDEYLMYRVDWLNKWQNNIVIEEIKNNINYEWQRILWIKINNFFIKKLSCKWNKSTIYYSILNILKKKKYKFPENKINHILIFNIINIPPIYLNILYKVSRFIKVDYFLINPCYKYWYDINLYYTYNNVNNNENINDLNIFLINYGKYFAQYLSLFFEININEKKYFKNIKKKNFLYTIKNSILHFKNFNIYENILKINNNINIKNDNSVIIKSCNGYLEEVKQLKKFLLNLILNKNFNVKDIIVYVTDIEKYYPYIKGIFSDPLYKDYLPFKILKKYNKYNNKILDLFIKLLNIYNLDYNFSDLLSFLKEEIIFKKFNISYDELNIILYIIKDIGVNLNFIQLKKKLFDNNFNYHTWIDSIKRILLGYCINNEFSIWNNIVPYSFPSSNFFNKFIKKICNFVFKIFYWKDILNKEYNFYNWIYICNKFLKDFFYEKYLIKNILLNKKINELYKYKKFTSDKKLINLEFFKKILIFFLKSNSRKLYSISHINFCSFSSLIFLPYKIVCMIGLNNNIFPKQNNTCSLNLINYYPRLGDHDKYNSDKYFFLEKIYFTKKKLYISYINYDFDKNIFSFPSEVLNLFNYKYNLKFNIIRNNNKYILYSKKIKNIIKINFKKYFYINKTNFLDIYKSNYLINLSEFHIFWLNPIKYLFRKVFRLNYYIYNKNIDNNELFNLNNNKYYYIKLNIINLLINNNINNFDILNYLKKINILPFSHIGNIIWKKEKYKILYFISLIKEKYLNCFNKEFFFKINNLYIKGNFTISNDNGIFKWFPRNLYIMDALLLWIDHLIYCYLGGKKNSYIYGYNYIWSFSNLNKKDSKYFLIKYTNGYLNNFNCPILLFPRLCNLWIFSAYNYKNKNIVNNFYLNIAKRKIYNYFYNNHYFKEEINNIYINYLFKKYYNILDINLIIKQIEYWLLPVFNNLIINKL